MEPPAKRLRILQSVPVDEEDPDYVLAKQKQQQKFKGRLESIFAKYEGMHESMSDEIDMRQNKVVVDRGHLRRLVRRQVNRSEAQLLDCLGIAAGPEPEDASGDEQDDGDSEDELAPTQCPRPKKRRLDDTGQGLQATPEVENSPAQLGHNSPLAIQQSHLIAQSPIQTGPQHSSNTPDPAADLLQLVQFPQTPAGQHAQTAFYTTLAQTINRAVQQAVAPLFSAILPQTPNLQLPFTNPQSAPTTPLLAGDKIVPAKDPKWYFPPLSSEARRPQAAQSSPTVAATNNLASGNTSPISTRKSVLPQESVKTGVEPTAESSRPSSHADSTCAQSSGRGDADPELQLLRQPSPRVEIKGKPVVTRRKYHFTKEDDIYISERKELHQLTWLEIKSSQAKWADWPVQVFQRRWTNHLRGKGLHLTNTPVSGPNMPAPVSQTRQKRVRGLNHRKPRSPSQSHHFPTPSSLEHGDDRKGSNDSQIEYPDEALPSSSHFDNDELDLLSLAGAETDEEPFPIGSHEHTSWDNPEDIVLPSIEMAEFVDEDTLQQGLLEDMSIDDPMDAPPKVAEVNVKTECLISSPISRAKGTTKPYTLRAILDSEDEEEDNADSELEEVVVDVDSTTKAKGRFLCTICQKSSMTTKSLACHHKISHYTHDKHPQTRSVSNDIVGDDEIQAPTTPYIKRESTTPLPTTLAFSTTAFRTPKTVPQHSDIHSSGSKSTSKLDRKAFLKQVKQSWTRGPKTVTKQKSFHTVPMKRAWGGNGESEDELA